MIRQEWEQKGIHCTLQQDLTQALLVVETQGGWQLVQACSEGNGFWLFFKQTADLQRPADSQASPDSATSQKELAKP